MDVMVLPRADGQVAACIDALREVYEADAYPVRWPVDPAGWLSPDDAMQSWVAVSAGRVLGHAVIRRATPPMPVVERMDPALGSPVMVSRLFTIPAARQNGVARRLLDEIAGWAVEHGHQLFLDVADNAPGARRFYERLGWKHVFSEYADWLDADGSPARVHYYLPG
ncbi:GNAT superfamily N-acetyltransferase [Hamadaea flava]|nr:GNAT superfamily N-acetyltransferase [Hamadaea flava]